jgi:predicted methyltransferase
MRARILVVVTLAVLLIVAQQALATLQTLSDVEAERDRWQRPSEILQALDLHPGDVVVDLGSGAGYFSLKLAPLVGARGRVLAVDLRRESLAFLWIRAMRRSYWNVHVIHGEADNPDLPADPVDAVLICNTYHELTAPTPILSALRTQTRPGAHLVVVDRASGEVESREAATGHHELSPSAASGEIARQGFEVIARDEPFIARSPDGDAWWLIVFRRS